MRRTIAVRRSRAADWAWLVGGLAVPVLILAALGKRADIISNEALIPVLGCGFLLAFGALALAVYALTDIWKSGAEGAGAAAAAIVYAAPALVLLGLIATAAFLYPPLTDVSTDVTQAPAFTGPRAPHRPPTAETGEMQRQSYPDLVPHIYSQPLADVHAAARELIVDRGWRVTRATGPGPSVPAGPGAPAPTAAEDDELVRALAAKGVATQSRNESSPVVATPGPEAQPEPPPDSGTALLEAEAPTPIFSFVDDVVVRLQATPDGTRVDMRSASRTGRHDLGQNARRIERFLRDLDAKLQPPPGGASPVASR